ncbi:MAG: RNA methyltransferase [Paramuribaculum sp.]|nr:RNA methyltransferase [Paramuribaculum sp.]MDE6782175.1 RNA methyltransferase [Paramuribaculum sp.]
MEKKTIFDLGRDTVEQYRARRKLPLTVVLDNVRSLNNIGSIFRTSDAFLVERIMLCGITATPPSPEIHKTALGAEESVAWEYYPSTLEALARLHAEGYCVCALEQVKESVSLEKFLPKPDTRYAIVAGHEVHGVDPAVVDDADVCIEIPQHGTKHSLNVSVSVALAIWHFFTRLL